MVSEWKKHDAATVYTFIDELISNVRDMVPDVKCIHYVSDSPTSQYRNKLLFYIVGNHQQMFNMTASWLYLEAGHGKGPCDGVGGTAKRMADEAVKTRTSIIQDAKDFYDWAESTQSAIKYTRAQIKM